MRYNNNENAIKCEFCHEPMNIQNNTFQLPVGTILAGRYYVGKVLGQGGFGITYIGCDLKLNMKMAIKEYYPQGLIGRVSKYDLKLTVNTGNQHTVYEMQKDRFMKEARILAEFASDIRIVRVTDIFEENNTAYIVMEYVEGITLEKYCKQYGRMTFDAIWDMMRPLAETLGKIHNRGLIHRDISPSNIMLNDSTGVKLIDFGAARDYSTTDDKSLSVVLKPGYAPPEQYSSRGQGPWTDVYALCATIYRAITGVIPMNAFERMSSDDLQYPSDLEAEINSEQEAILMCGLAVKKTDRIQSMNELRDAIATAKNGYVIDHVRPFYRNNNHSSNDLTSCEIKNDNSSTNASQIGYSNTAKTGTDEDIQQALEEEYKSAVYIMKYAEDIEAYRNAILRFQELGDYKNAREYIIECDNSIRRLKNSITINDDNNQSERNTKTNNINEDVLQKQEMKYKNAVNVMNSAIGIGGYEVAIDKLKELGNYKDAQELAEECQRRIEEEKYENEQRNEHQQFERQKKAKIKFAIIILVLTGVFVAIYFTVVKTILNNDAYNTAVTLTNDKNNEAAPELDEKYNRAILLMDGGAYQAALDLFKELGRYKDSDLQIKKCNEAIEGGFGITQTDKDIKYNRATSLINSGDYQSALTLFKELDGYKDSKKLIEKCNEALSSGMSKTTSEKDDNYNRAMSFMNAGDYQSALTLFRKLGEYKDSEKQFERCINAVYEEISNDNYNEAYILPDSDKRNISESELRKMDSTTLRRAKNEIYARHGRKFKSDDLQQYFDSQPWYKGTISPELFDESVLNEYEKCNAYLMQKIEDERK